MTPFPRGKRGNLSIYIPRQSLPVVERSTRTNDKKLVRSYEIAIEWLATQTPPAWDVLEALIAKRVTFAQLVELHAAGRASLAPLRAKLADVALLPQVEPFRTAWLADGKAERTLDNYVREVTAYLTAHPMRSDWTRTNLTAHLRGLDITSGSRAKHLYALRSFERYLVDVGVLDTTPAQTVRAPKRNKKRLRYESAAVDAVVCAAVEPRYRAACALIHATGADVSSILPMVGRDLDLTRLRCHIPGTKRDQRDRHEAVIDAWALPFLEALRATLPNAPLFTGLSRHELARKHREACAAVSVADYTLRDARHSVAVRMRKAGASFEAVAQQLGNSVWQCVSVYAAFTADDMAAELAAHATNRATSADTPAPSLSIKRA
jgi:site-specific recombinase XerD